MKNEKKIVKKKEIDEILEKVAFEIMEKHSDLSKIALIGIQRRGVFLAERLKKIIEKNKKIDVAKGSLDINLYRDDWTQIDVKPIVQPTKINFSVDNKKNILIDDVLFTGRTIRAAMDALSDLGRPLSIELFALIDRENHRELPIQANYVGLSIKTKKQEQVNVWLNEIDKKEYVSIGED